MNLYEKIKNREEKISLIGLGYVETKIEENNGCVFIL